MECNFNEQFNPGVREPNCTSKFRLKEEVTVPDLCYDKEGDYRCISWKCIFFTMSEFCCRWHCFPRPPLILFYGLDTNNGDSGILARLPRLALLVAGITVLVGSIL
jgi:hypothetical protein